MSINYKLIADDDPGGELETAFATMSVVTVVNEKIQARYTDQDIAREIGFGPANQFLDDVEAAVPGRVAYWLRTLGIDVAHIDTINVLNNLDPAPRNLNLVLALKNEKIPKYGFGFKEGHLQTARKKLAEGKI
jgi:hypothetical protein